jgi:hypothetical protein
MIVLHIMCLIFHVWMRCYEIDRQGKKNDDAEIKGEKDKQKEESSSILGVSLDTFNPLKLAEKITEESQNDNYHTY